MMILNRRVALMALNQRPVLRSAFSSSNKLFSSMRCFATSHTTRLTKEQKRKKQRKQQQSSKVQQELETHRRLNAFEGDEKVLYENLKSWKIRTLSALGASNIGMAAINVALSLNGAGEHDISLLEPQYAISWFAMSSFFMTMLWSQANYNVARLSLLKGAEFFQLSTYNLLGQLKHERFAIGDAVIEPAQEKLLARPTGYILFQLKGRRNFFMMEKSGRFTDFKTLAYVFGCPKITLLQNSLQPASEKQ